MNDTWWIVVFFVVVFLLALLFWLTPILDPFRSQRTIRRHSSSFFEAFSSLKDPRMRRGVFAVYAFGRKLEDAAHKRQDRELLEIIEADFLKAIEGQRVGHWLFAELMWTAETFYPEDYDYKPFFDMFVGRKIDLTQPRFKTNKQLLDYCQLVAGTAGRMINPILAKEETPGRRKFADDLGIAMQLTTILKDLKTDPVRFRDYLPDEMTDKSTIDWAVVEKGEASEAFQKIVDEISEMAESRYRSAQSAIVEFPVEVRDSLDLSISVYRAILSKVRQADYVPSARRRVLSRRNKRKVVLDWLKQRHDVGH
jgi:phytoene synthase